MNSIDIAKIAVKAADSKKGKDIQVIGKIGRAHV